VIASSRSAITIRHSGNLDSKLRKAQSYLSQFSTAFDNYRESAQKLLATYSPEQAKEYISALFPAPEQTASKRTQTNHAARVAAVREAFRSPAQSMNSVRGTWWALFNSVTETVDHGSVVRRSRDIRARQENRFLSVTTGQGAAFKERAFELAISMAA